MQSTKIGTAPAQTTTSAVAAKVKAGNKAYIWVYFPPGFQVLGKGGVIEESATPAFRLCKVWWNVAKNHMCWAVLSHKEHNQPCILPNWLKRHKGCIDLNELPTEKEAGFSKSTLNSDDFKEARFNEELLWLMASTEDGEINYPPGASTCTQMVVEAFKTISLIIDVIGKPVLEQISAAIQGDRTFATSMLSALKKMEKAHLETGRQFSLIEKDIGSSTLMRRDFYYFAKDLLEDEIANAKMEPWSDKARLVCPCMMTKGRTKQVERCLTCGNGLGLESERRPGQTPWRTVWEQEVRPAPLSKEGKRIVGEERKFFCWCGQEFDTSQEREKHRANSSDDKRHGPMPYESQLVGGACIIVNLVTGSVEVSSRRLKIQRS
jgi:hypothetical protein